MGSGINNGSFWYRLKKAVQTKSTPASGLTDVTVKDGVGSVVTTVITFTDKDVTMTDAGANGSHGSLKMIDFPEGNIVILGASTDLAIERVGTALTATSAVVGAVGTTATATDNATLTTTEANIVPSTVSTLTAGAGATAGQSTAVAVIDGTAAAISAYLNFATPDAGSTGNDALTVNGTVTVVWTTSGDN